MDLQSEKRDPKSTTLEKDFNVFQFFREEKEKKDFVSAAM